MPRSLLQFTSRTLNAVWLGLFLLAAVLQAVEPRQWPIELKVGRFEIHADFDVSQNSTLSPELSALAEDIGTVLRIESSDQPVHIVLFESGSEYQRYMQAYFPALPRRRALYIQDRGPGMLFAHCHPDMATDLRHEITHALLNDGQRPLPLWLDEGLAEYFELPKQRRFEGSSYLSQVVQRAQAGLVPSLKKLEESDELSGFADVQYRDSWSWVHFFIHRNSATRQLLVRYLSDHRGGVDQLSLSRQLQQITQDASGEYQSHFQSMVAAKSIVANE